MCLGPQWKFFCHWIRLNTSTVISYTSATEKPHWPNRMQAIYAVSWNCQMFRVTELYTFSCGRQKNCHLVLCLISPFLSHSVKMIDRSPSCLHQATTVQLLNHPQYVCYGKPLKKHGCLENTDLENADHRPQTSKTQTSKTQTFKRQTSKTQSLKMLYLY